MKNFGSSSLFALLIFLFAASYSKADVLQITSGNLEDSLKTKLMFVNFYADWCRFSRMLAPIFKDAADLVAKEFSSADVVFGRVDCDAEQGIAQRFSVNKYPTMKLFRNGVMVKREYRGQRTAESIATFIRDQLKDPVKEVKNLDEIYELKRDKRTIVGYFESKDSDQYRNFDAISKMLKDDCDFYAAFGEVSQPERTSGDNVIFKPQGDNSAEMVYLGSLTNKDLLQAWTQDKCVPLVREITFQNGEELTEEGLPFLILFHSKEDTESLEIFTKEVSRLVSFKSAVNFLEADCETFSHPLHHLGKTTRDCPLVAIDSFRHMYMFPEFSQISEPGKLKQFILDLQSGKLHREFHHGPDESNQPAVPDKSQGQIQMQPVVQVDEASQQPPEAVQQLERKARQIEEGIKQAEKIVEQEQQNDQGGEGNNNSDEPHARSTQAPSGGGGEETTIKSVFANLKPSQHRYTIVDYKRDEL